MTGPRRCRRRPTAALLIAVLLSGGISACEDEPEPNFTSPSATPTESTPTTSPTPEAESAEAFLDRWVIVSREMQNTGDTAAYRAITDLCEPCRDTADKVEQYYAAGGYVRTEGRTIRSVTPTGGSAELQGFRVKMDTAPTQYKESAGGEVKTLPGGPIVLDVDLQRDQLSWQVYHVVGVEQ